MIGIALNLHIILGSIDVLTLFILPDFPFGTVDKNPPADAGDRGLIPGPGRFHMPQSNQAGVPQLLSPCSRAHEP